MAIVTLPLEKLSYSPELRRALAEVNTKVVKAKRILVVSGAGISCSSGIPVSPPSL
jgi:NAD-dependent histone deacetylase SIR2